MSMTPKSQIFYILEAFEIFTHDKCLNILNDLCDLFHSPLFNLDFSTT